MSDLETRVRDTLTDHAGAAGDWRVPGEVLRRAAADRASSRRRTAAVAASALVVAGIVGVATWSGDGPRDAAPAEPSPSPSSTETRPADEPDPAWLQVEVTDDLLARARDAAGVDGTWRPVASTDRWAGNVVVALGNEQTVDADRQVSVVTVTFDTDIASAPARSGTKGTYGSWSEVIAQPTKVRFGDWRAALVVLLQPDETLTVTAINGGVGQTPRAASGAVEGGIALIPMMFGPPEELTGLILGGSDGSDTTVVPLPIGSMAEQPESSSAPVIVASTAGGEPQVVQVRTTGDVACRMTIGSWWDGPPQLPWNAFDVACATIDNEGLQLLLADDRMYSSVTGTAPVGTSFVRLFWRVGKETESSDVPVTRSGGVVAFIDSSKHRADQLIRAEAWNDQGDVVATALPPPPAT